MKVRLISLGAILLLLSIAAVPQQSRLGTDVKMDLEEYSVYAEVIKRLSADGLIEKPLISDQTSTFQCGTSCNGMLVGKCSGMRLEAETPSQALDRIGKQLPSLKQETVTDFEGKNQLCVHIQKLLPLSTPYFLFSRTQSEDLPKDWKHPDMVYFSRVGFNPGNTQALVYIAVMSGTDVAHSGGTYILVEREDKTWKVRKRVRVWDLGG